MPRVGGAVALAGGWLKNQRLGCPDLDLVLHHKGHKCELVIGCLLGFMKMKTNLPRGGITVL